MARRVEVVMAGQQVEGLGVDLGEVLVGQGQALPDWAFKPGTILGMQIGGVGDFGIVRKGGGEGEVVLSSVASRTRRVHQRAAIEAVRPLVVIPVVKLEGLEKPVENGLYQLPDGRVVRCRGYRWTEVRTGRTVALPLVPKMVVRWVPRPRG